MKLKVFVDTNVFIYAFEYRDSNSAKVIDLLNKGLIEVFVSGQVVKEIVRYFERFHSNELARLFRQFLYGSCVVVLHDAVHFKMQEFRGQIKEKDLEQLTVAKMLGLKYLVAYDRDFDGFSEYITPKKFIKMMKHKESQTEY